MTNKPKHTPTPWKHLGHGLISCAETGFTVATVTSPWSLKQESDDPNAEFIVRACNAHDELLIAAKYALHALEAGTISETEHDNLINQLYQAIIKAECQCYRNARTIINDCRDS